MHEKKSLKLTSTNERVDGQKVRNGTTVWTLRKKQNPLIKLQDGLNNLYLYSTTALPCRSTKQIDIYALLAQEGTQYF